ncbi:ribonuclease HII [Chromobacterium piscinae]|uniref:ribonuclease HII n=1 Tax=Chromobacterium piscinae TaxID=686831 RepID=UPI003208C7E9
MPLICGVDEAGRGPLAGAVFTAAVILDPAKPIAGLADSKVLSEAKRDALAELIKRDALAWCIASASVEEIDKLNILHATMLAMTRAVEGLPVRPDLAQIDGNRVPKHLPVPGEAIVKGDAKVAAISAASILAKTARDAELVALDALHPQYGFARHKGYPTAEHLAAIEAYGVLLAHRKTFGPVRAWLASHQGALF